MSETITASSVAARPWPSVAVIVPVAGVTSFTVECLRALLDQDSPAYEVVLVTRDADDEAVPVVRELLRGLRSGVHGLHVVSGVARSCSQKNHSLIAGVRNAGPADILVFADADHVPPPHWLRALVGPLARGEATVSTAYHRIDPHEPGLIPTAHAFTVLILSLAQRSRWVSLLWGGSMAITRALFDELAVADLWSRHMVDDMSLARLLRRRRVRTQVVRGAATATPLGRERLTAWNRWLFRQLFFLKFYFRGMWCALGVLLVALMGLSVSALAVALGLVRAAPGTVAAAWIHLGAVGMALVVLRQRRVSPVPAWRWVAAALVVLVTACAAHGLTWFARSFTWRDLRYRVDRLGHVIDVRMADGRARARSDS